MIMFLFFFLLLFIVFWFWWNTALSLRQWIHRFWNMIHILWCYLKEINVLSFFHARAHTFVFAFEFEDLLKNGTQMRQSQRRPNLNRNQNAKGMAALLLGSMKRNQDCDSKTLWDLILFQINVFAFSDRLWRNINNLIWLKAMIHQKSFSLIHAYIFFFYPLIQYL